MIPQACDIDDHAAPGSIFHHRVARKRSRRVRDRAATQERYRGTYMNSAVLHTANV